MASYDPKSNEDVSLLVPSYNQIFAIQKWSDAIVDLLNDIVMSKTRLNPLSSRDLYLALVRSRTVLYAKKHNFELNLEIESLRILCEDIGSNETNEKLTLIKKHVYEPLLKVQDLYKQAYQYIPMPTDLSLSVLNSFLIRNALRFFPGLFRNTIFQVRI